MKKIYFLPLLVTMLFLSCSKDEEKEKESYVREGKFPKKIFTPLTKSVEITKKSSLKSGGIVFGEIYMPKVLDETSTVALNLVGIERLTRNIAPKTGKVHSSGLTITVDDEFIKDVTDMLPYTDNNPVLENLKKVKGNTSSPVTNFKFEKVTAATYVAAKYAYSFTINTDEANEAYYISNDGTKVRVEISVKNVEKEKHTFVYDDKTATTKYSYEYLNVDSSGNGSKEKYEIGLVLEEGNDDNKAGDDATALSIIFKKDGKLDQEAYCFGKEDKGFFAVRAVAWKLGDDKYDLELFSADTDQVLYGEHVNGTKMSGSDDSQKADFESIKTSILDYLKKGDANLKNTVPVGTL